MRRCTQADKKTAYKKSIALIISLAMLASGLYAGPAFAVETTDSEGADINTEYTDTGAEPEAEAGNGEYAGDEATVEAAPEEEAVIAEEEPQNETQQNEPQQDENADAVEDTGTVKTMGIHVQPVRVAVSVNGAKMTLLEPDEYGRYTVNSKIAALRAEKNIRILISNPAESPMSFSDQNIAANTAGLFLETEATGCTVNDIDKIKELSSAVAAAGGVMSEAQPILEGQTGDGNVTTAGGTDVSGVEGEGDSGNGEGEDPAGQEPEPVNSNAVQVTEVVLTVNGTGEAAINFSAPAGDVYAPASGKIIIKQTRPTSVINRDTSVRGTTAAPTTIGRVYREKYFKIIRKKDGNDKKVYRYKNVRGAFEIKRASGVSESGYRAVQGGNSDGTYAYTAMGKKGSSTYCKIVKTRLSDMKVVKVSGNLKLNHANDITFDPANYRLVVTHNDKHTMRVSFVNPDSLTVTGYKDISVPSTLKGATKSQLSAIEGFSSVTYMRDGKYAGNYIAVISGYHNFLVLSPNFKPIEYITVSTKLNGSQVYYQGADNINGNLYIAIFPRDKKYHNMISIYNMDGEFQGKITLNSGYELENVFHSGSIMYVTLYKKVKKTWYTTKAVKKKVKLSKKERKKLAKALKSKQSKKGTKGKKAKKGKKIKVPKYKTVIKLKKVKHKKTVKRSYIFKMDMVTL